MALSVFLKDHSIRSQELASLLNLNQGPGYTSTLAWTSLVDALDRQSSHLSLEAYSQVLFRSSLSDQSLPLSSLSVANFTLPVPLLWMLSQCFCAPFFVEARQVFCFALLKCLVLG